MALIIVESPTKARTFNRILSIEGKKDAYYVFATMGHIRDLPSNEMAIDFSRQFEPQYAYISKRKKVIEQMRELASQNDEIILATDPDREGESISYHAAYILGLIKENWPNFSFADTAKKVKRIVFHEITPRALKEALENPQELRVNLVKAQQARRILDRIVGYQLSPLLWKKTGKNWLSAGRVQTVAVRLIVEREKEREAFSANPYLLVSGLFSLGGTEVFAKLTHYQGTPIDETKKVVVYAGEYSYTRTILQPEDTDDIQAALKKSNYVAGKTEETVSKRYPQPPFTTSTLQQDAFFKFGFTSKMVMSLAQSLYEKGLITYHRTDSFNLSTQFVFKAKDYIIKQFGTEYALEKPRGYRTKSRLAQEAHEAIRPTKLISLSDSASKKDSLTVNHKKLYKLIFDRAVATQMKEAEIKTTTIEFESKEKHIFKATGQTTLFDGFLKLMDPEKKTSIALPKHKEGDVAKLISLDIKEQKTQAPPRYNEASLIRTLEEKGIGRPSTYAAIISLIQTKGYVEKDWRYFIPTPIGNSISDYLSTHFSLIFELDFTSGMEEKLDRIAEGEADLIAILNEFYGPFQKQLEERKKDVTTIQIKETTTEQCPKCSKPLVLRYSRYGKFYACSGYPGCKFTKPFLHVVKNHICPQCGEAIVVKFTKSKKKFYGCSQYPKCNFSSWVLSKAEKAPLVKPVVS